MADWVGVGRFLLGEAGEEPQQSHLRTDMEGGVPKQRPRSSLEMFSRPATVLFTQSEYAQFKTWRRDTVNNGNDWFTMEDYLDGATKAFRIIGGKYQSRFTDAGPDAPLDVIVSFTLEVLE